MDLSCGFSGLMNADQPSPPPNGYLQSVVYGDNGSLPAAMAAEDASYLFMEDDNSGQYLGDNLWVSEYYNVQNVEQSASYLQVKILI